MDDGDDPGSFLDGDDPSSFVDELEAWAAEGRAEQAAAARARERWLRQQAEEEASLLGVLTDLVERGAAAAVSTASGRRHQGRLAALGRDFVALRVPGGFDVLVRITSVASVRPGPGPVPPTSGSPRRPVGLALVDVLARVASERPRAQLGLRGGDVVTGELRGIGADVVTVRLDGEPRGLAYVRLDSISDISLFDSG